MFNLYILITLHPDQFHCHRIPAGRLTIDDAKTHSIQQLGTLLQGYKHANQVPTNEIDRISGDSSALGHGRTQELLLFDIEDRQGVLSAQGDVTALAPPDPPPIPNLQPNLALHASESDLAKINAWTDLRRRW